MTALPLVMLAFLYFVMIRPQSRRTKEHRAMVSAIAKGDEVVTSGGLAGRVNNVGEAVRPLARLGEINCYACRQRVQERFSIETMVAGYEQVYRTVFELEGNR